MKLRKLTIALVSAMIMANIASAQVPRLINFQGFLTGPGGQPRNGTFELIFAITNAAGDQFWGETNASVDVNNGLFNVVLGNITPFGTDVFPLDAQATNRWLGVRVAGQPLTPGQQFISMPYALLANNAFALDGITAANLSYATNALIGATNALNVATNALQVQVKDLQDATNELNKATNALNLATNSLQVQVKDLQDATNELNKATNALNLATNSLQVQAKQLQDATNALNIATNALQVQIYSLSNTVGYVVGPAGRASYQTIQAAINAAMAAGFGQARPVTIEVKPGEYTENLTFFAGIHLKAEIEDALFSVRVRGNHQYNYTDVNLGDLFISGIWFDASATSGNAPIFTIGGNGFTSIRMNHCVLDSSDNQPVMRLSNTGFQGTRLSNTEMFHCRIRNLRADFTGTALVELNSGSLLLDDGEATLVDNAEISFRASGASQLRIDNAQIRGRIVTMNTAFLQLTQSAIDSGALASIVHNSTTTAIMLEALLVSTLQGNIVAGNGVFLYNNLAYFNSFQGIAQTLPATAVAIRAEIDHGLLRGLGDDDHGQYHNNTRGDTRYAGTDWDGTTRLKTAQDHIANRNNPHVVTLAQLGYSDNNPTEEEPGPSGTDRGEPTRNEIRTWGQLDDGNPGEEPPGYGTRGEPTREEIELWGDANDWDQDDHASVSHTSFETDPQVGANTPNYVPRWDGAALVSGTISDNGNVGIGTSPSGYKLDVNGDAVVRGPLTLNKTGGTYTSPDFRVYGATRLYQAYGTLFPTIVNPDFKVDGTTLHEGEVASKGGFWAAQVKYAGYDAFRAGASVYGLGDTAHGSMTVEGSLAVGLGGPGDTGNWAAYPDIGHIYKSGVNHFRIVHPVDTNKFLIHSGVESPLAELIYRGKAQLSNGVATVNLNTYYGLIPHTLDSILTNLSVMVYNNASWTRVRCPAVSGVSFIIEAETTNCNDVVEWIAIGKRIGENVSDDIELDE